MLNDVDRIPAGRFPDLVDRVGNEPFDVALRFPVRRFVPFGTGRIAVAQQLVGIVLKGNLAVTRRILVVEFLNPPFFNRVAQNRLVPIDARVRLDERANRSPAAAVVRGKGRTRFIRVGKRRFENVVHFRVESVARNALLRKLFRLLLQNVRELLHAVILNRAVMRGIDRDNFAESDA